jgi:hypothetical protein
LEEIIMAATVLTAAQESEAKKLEDTIRLAIEKEVASLARLLASTDDRDLFGKTEFEVRDLVLKIGAKAYEERLREKKWLPRIGSRVPVVSAVGGVSRISSAAAAQHSGADRFGTGVLLLPPLRRRSSVGPAGGTDGQAFDASGRGVGDLGGHDGRELRGSGGDTAPQDGVAALVGIGGAADE